MDQIHFFRGPIAEVMDYERTGTLFLENLNLSMYTEKLILSENHNM